MPTPCSNCPWRKDAPLNTWEPERWQNLFVTCQDDGIGVMACHKSKEEADKVCAGFAVQVGFASVGLRLLAMRGEFDRSKFSDGGLDLYAGFEEVLEANSVEPPPRNTVIGRERDAT